MARLRPGARGWAATAPSAALMLTVLLGVWLLARCWLVAGFWGLVSALEPFFAGGLSLGFLEAWLTWALLASRPPRHGIENTT